MAIDDDTLMAYADGELSGADAARVEEALAQDAELAEKVARLRSVRRAVSEAYAPIAEDGVPQRLSALLQEPAAVIDFASARERRARFGAPAWAAIAASVVLGLVVGRMSAPEDAVFAQADGRLIAGAALARVLDTGLASQAQNDARIGLTFRDQDGEYCRTFTRAAARAVTGLACREGEAWAVRIAVAHEAGGDYRQASAPAPILDMVDQIIEGEPLDAEAERAARDRGWRE